MPTFDRGDVHLYYEETGEGFPLLLFAPGGMRSSIRFWEGSPFDPRVELGGDFRVVAMDQRNAGRSSAPVTAADGWHAYTADHLALLDHLGIERCHALGGCIGSSYCLGLAAAAPERIHFAGSVGDVERYLRAADLFALPSQREGFPNSVLEAMATGLPVVVTPFVGFSERIGRPGRELLQTERSPAALAEALSALLIDRERRGALGSAARDWVETRLGVEHSLDRYAALYHELARR